MRSIKLEGPKIIKNTIVRLKREAKDYLSWGEIIGEMRIELKTIGYTWEEIDGMMVYKQKPWWDRLYYDCVGKRQ